MWMKIVKGDENHIELEWMMEIRHEWMKTFVDGKVQGWRGPTLIHLGKKGGIKRSWIEETATNPSHL
jgi:hypothetical protein